MSIDKILSEMISEADIINDMLIKAPLSLIGKEEPELHDRIREIRRLLVVAREGWMSSSVPVKVKAVRK